MKKKNSITRNGLLRLLALVLVLVLCSTAFVSCVRFDTKIYETTLSRSEIEENMENYDSEGKYNYAAYYLREFGIRNFNRAKLALAEEYFYQYYVSPLPSVYTLAVLTAEYFLDNYYDSIDLKSSEETTDALLDSFTRATGDRYAYYRTAEQYKDYTDSLEGNNTSVGIGVRVEISYTENLVMVSAVIPSSGADTSGILPGDYIIGAGSKTVEEHGIDDTLDEISGEVDSFVDITVLRDGEELHFSVRRAVLADTSVFFSSDSDNVGYIQITEFNGNTPDQFIYAIESLEEAGVRGIVFDLRNNPGGLLSSVVEIIDYLAPDNQRIVSYTFTGGSPTVYMTDDGHYVDLPMTVICNEYTASAGELFTAALRDYGKEGIMDVKIVGNTTFGKGIMQSSVSLGDGSYLTFTIAFYFPPSGTNYDGVGILPDVVVTDVSKQKQAAKDTLLDLIENLGSGGVDFVAA